MIDSVELRSILADHRKYHSRFQIRNFIVAKSSAGTTYGAYRQSVRELYGRVRNLRRLGIDRDELELHIERLETRRGAVDRKGETFSVRQIDIALARKRLALDELDLGIRETAREFGEFYHIATALKKVLGDFDDDEREEMEELFWRNELSKRVSLDSASTGRVSAGTMELEQSIEVGSTLLPAGAPSAVDLSIAEILAIPEVFDGADSSSGS